MKKEVKETILLVPGTPGLELIRGALGDDYDLAGPDGADKASSRLPGPALAITGAIGRFRDIIRLPCGPEVVFVGDGEASFAEAYEAGVIWHFLLSDGPDELRLIVRHALRRRRALCGRGPDEKDRHPIIGDGPEIKEVLSRIKKAAPSDLPVLILGESGTGKELAAIELHRQSGRRGRMVTINCGAIPEGLLEAELFGYEKGAFTGAQSASKGRIEYAAGGTVFFDEVGELSPRLQVKLLRFLQDRTIERIGGRRLIELDTRVVAATNRDIAEMTRSGEFRADLFFRLGALTILMPPLRRRGSDVITLAAAFLKRHSQGPGEDGFTKEAVEAIKKYDWPGNVRELENRVRRALAMGRGKKVTPQDLGFDDVAAAGGRVTLPEAKDGVGKRLVQEALLENNGAIVKSAESLGISRQYLSRLIKKYGIKSPGGL